MIYVLIILSAVQTFLSYLECKKWSSPAVVFNGVWTFSYLASGINFSNFFDISEKVLWILFLGQIIFNLGIIFSSLVKIRFREANVEKKASVLSQHTWIPELLLILLMIPFVIVAYGQIQEGGFSSQRASFATNEYDFFTPFQRIFYIYTFVFPLNKALCLLEISEFVQSKKIRIGFVLSFIGIFLETLITAGRFAIADVIFCFLVVYSFFSKDGFLEERKKFNINVFIIVAIVLIGASIVSADRMQRSESLFVNLFYNVAEYFSIGPRLFDIALENPIEWGLQDFSLGGYVFAGAFELLRLFFSTLGLTVNINFFAKAQEVVGLYYTLSPNGTQRNAFPTMYYYFMRDFSWVGVIIVPFLLAIVVQYFYKYVKTHPTPWTALKYSYIILPILYSPCWWQPIRVEYWSTLIWMVVCHRVFSRRGAIK